jgi:hypothetical protein
MYSAFGVDHGEIRKAFNPIKGAKSAGKAYGSIFSGSHPTYGALAERSASNAVQRSRKTVDAGRFGGKKPLSARVTRQGKSDYASGQAIGARERAQSAGPKPPLPSWLK